MLLAPQPSLEHNIQQGLLLNEIVISFSSESLRDPGGLCEVDAIGSWLPVLLDRLVLGHFYVG